MVNAALISGSVGCGVFSSSSAALTIMLLWQKPHRGVCSSIHACWSRQILLFRPPRRQAFERGHFLAYSRGGRRNAGPNLFSVQQDRAGATLRQAATKLGACHFEFVSKDVKQGSICRSVHLTFPAVDGERDHLLQPMPNAGRALSQCC